MRNITPLKLVAEEPDLYRLYGRTKDGDVCYSFPMSWHGNEGRLRSLDHEDSYYFVTYDDPEGNTVEQCIHRFDKARQDRMNSSGTSLIPECILIEPVENPGRFVYMVISASPEGKAEHLVSITDTESVRICDWEFGSAIATVDSKGFWNTPKDADPLLQTILILHQAIHPKYKNEDIIQ